MKTWLPLALLATCPLAPAQEYGPADTGQPGDAMIRAYLKGKAVELDAGFGDDAEALEVWRSDRERLRAEYLDMLGLLPLPERSDLEATVTGTVEGDGFTVENLHFQSVPGLYVTANLYRPPSVEPGAKLPAVLYVCGHAGMGRDGGKTAFQSHGIWFARHGYVCLVVDTLQLGEIPGIHHGTYREGRWWWISRGYTPAGVECWNGVRGLDYLVSRPDVDAERLAVTGISGGGAATFWIAAADERVKVAVPVSGMADLESYVGNRVVNGHCDCMFLHNSHQWPWTGVAALIAPRPLLFVNSDADAIFPMDANARVISRLERLYSLYGAGDRVDAVVSIGGHAYRSDIRQSVYRFINTWLKGDSRPVEDSDVDAVAETRPERPYPIEPAKLRVFATDADLPADALNGKIDETFVPVARIEPPEEGKFEEWRDGLVAELRRRVFPSFPDRIPAAKVVRTEGDIEWIETEPGIEIPLKLEGDEEPSDTIFLQIGEDEATGRQPNLINPRDYRIMPRGTGPTAWTAEDPPNTVARSHLLLGRTIDEGRIRDVAAAARLIADRHGEDRHLIVVGHAHEAPLAIYAALFEPSIDQIWTTELPESHMDADAPPILNVLRVLDIPEAAGLLAPRSFTPFGGSPGFFQRVRTIYDRAGAADRFGGVPDSEKAPDAP